MKFLLRVAILLLGLITSVQVYSQKEDHFPSVFWQRPEVQDSLIEEYSAPGFFHSILRDSSIADSIRSQMALNEIRLDSMEVQANYLYGSLQMSFKFEERALLQFRIGRDGKVHHLRYVNPPLFVKVDYNREGVLHTIFYCNYDKCDDCYEQTNYDISYIVETTYEPFNCLSSQTNFKIFKDRNRRLKAIRTHEKEYRDGELVRDEEISFHENVK
jgi:hypothetical protein